jgi:hypothetical protein
MLADLCRQAADPAWLALSSWTRCGILGGVCGKSIKGAQGGATEAMTPTFQKWPQAVHEVLRTWRSGGLAEMPWAGLALVRQRLAEQILPNLEAAVKEIVLEALNLLEKRARHDEARILRLRFLDGLTATAVASRLNLSANVIYKTGIV